MNWSELIDAVAGRTGESKATVRSVLDALEEEAIEALGRADSVSLKGLGKLDVQEVAPRAIRRIHDQRKYYLGRRHRVRLRPGAAARRAVASLAEAHWRDPAHQDAWRRAETLLSDLALYHGKRAPSLDASLPHDRVRDQLQSAFGQLWERVRRAYEADVSTEVRETSDYLAEAALRRWAR